MSQSGSGPMVFFSLSRHIFLACLGCLSKLVLCVFFSLCTVLRALRALRARCGRSAPAARAFGAHAYDTSLRSVRALRARCESLAIGKTAPIGNYGLPNRSPGLPAGPSGPQRARKARSGPEGPAVGPKGPHRAKRGNLVANYTEHKLKDHTEHKHLENAPGDLPQFTVTHRK